MRAVYVLQSLGIKVVMIDGDAVGVETRSPATWARPGACVCGETSGEVAELQAGGVAWPMPATASMMPASARPTSESPSVLAPTWAIASAGVMATQQPTSPRRR